MAEANTPLPTSTNDAALIESLKALDDYPDLFSAEFNDILEGMDKTPAKEAIKRSRVNTFNNNKTASSSNVVEGAESAGRKSTKTTAWINPNVDTTLPSVQKYRPPIRMLSMGVQRPSYQSTRVVQVISPGIGSNPPSFRAGFVPPPRPVRSNIDQLSWAQRRIRMLESQLRSQETQHAEEVNRLRNKITETTQLYEGMKDANKSHEKAIDRMNAMLQQSQMYQAGVDAANFLLETNKLMKELKARLHLPGIFDVFQVLQFVRPILFTQKCVYARKIAKEMGYNPAYFTYQPAKRGPLNIEHAHFARAAVRKVIIALEEDEKRFTEISDFCVNNDIDWPTEDDIDRVVVSDDSFSEGVDEEDETDEH